MRDNCIRILFMLSFILVLFNLNTMLTYTGNGIHNSHFQLNIDYIQKRYQGQVTIYQDISRLLHALQIKKNKMHTAPIHSFFFSSSCDIYTELISYDFKFLQQEHFNEHYLLLFNSWIRILMACCNKCMYLLIHLLKYHSAVQVLYMDLFRHIDFYL